MPQREHSQKSWREWCARLTFNPRLHPHRFMARAKGKGSARRGGLFARWNLEKLPLSQFLTRNEPDIAM